MSGGITTIPRGLHHLEAVHGSKFVGRWPSRLPHPSTSFVQPADRIRRWNIRPGDKVRLLVGKARDKYFDESKGARGGWKVHTIKAVDMERNRVFLEGVSNKRSATTLPKPENWGSMGQEERQRWESESTVAPSIRPVHYSNVQLCVEENGADSVFASRITTTEPWFNRTTRRLEWDRFAAKLSGPSSLPPDPELGLVHISWPDKKVAKQPIPTNLDTADSALGGAISTTPTLSLPHLPTLLNKTSAPDLIPASSRSSPPADQGWSNAYLTRDHSKKINEGVDSVMPLYLSEELSPRFSRAKKTKGWNDRREVAILEREETAKAAVAAWEAQGRDKGLKEVLSEVGLEGIRLRGRTRKEIREAALAEYDLAAEGVKAEVKDARRRGRVWQSEGGEGFWVEGEKGERLARKQHRKELSTQKAERRMERLTLAETRNTVVPPLAQS